MHVTGDDTALLNHKAPKKECHERNTRISRMSIKARCLMFSVGTAAATVLIGTAPAAAAAPCDRVFTPSAFKHNCMHTPSGFPGAGALEDLPQRSPEIGETPRAQSPRGPTTSANSITGSAARQAEGGKGSHK